MKAHVKVEEWQTGSFHIERHARCRCGEVFTHYNRGEVNRMFKEHQSAAAPPGRSGRTIRASPTSRVRPNIPEGNLGRGDYPVGPKIGIRE